MIIQSYAQSGRGHNPWTATRVGEAANPGPADHDTDDLSFDYQMQIEEVHTNTNTWTNTYHASTETNAEHVIKLDDFAHDALHVLQLGQICGVVWWGVWCGGV